MTLLCRRAVCFAASDIDGELDLIDTVHWFPTMYRKDYQVGYSFSAGVADNPDDAGLASSRSIP